jgi:hypothetical protein
LSMDTQGIRLSPHPTKQKHQHPPYSLMIDLPAFLTFTILIIYLFSAKVKFG